MHFTTDAQRACYERLMPWIQDLYPDQVILHDALPIFVIPGGSAVAYVEVAAWGDDAMVRTWAYVVTGAELSAELMHYLLRQNAELPFGAFSLDEDGDIRFEHAIVGSTCDLKELRASAEAVMRTADEFDDAIRSRAGGERAVERLGLVSPEASP